MGRKEERITFLRKFLPFDLLHREIDGNDANFPRKLYFRIETRMEDYARFFFFPYQILLTSNVRNWKIGNFSYIEDIERNL